MCQQRTVVILLSISIFIMIAAMLILLYTSNVDEKSNNSSKDSVKLPYSSEFCSNARAKCRDDPACRVALDYIQIACRYSDHDSVCSKYCQTMVTCLSTNPMASDIFQCSCGPYPLPNERRALNSMPVTPNSLGSQFSSSTQNPSSSSNSQSAWCFPLDVSWCKRNNLTPTNRAICANLATCSPLPRICKANLTIQGCEHVQLERDAEDDCNYLFNETHCSNLCSMDTKTAYQRTKVRALHECICQKYSTPCDLEKSLIVTHCLTRKPNQ